MAEGERPFTRLRCNHHGTTNPPNRKSSREPRQNDVCETSRRVREFRGLAAWAPSMPSRGGVNASVPFVGSTAERNVHAPRCTQMLQCLRLPARGLRKERSGSAQV
eukprot:TRINITY_DN2630_c0_g1_i2.p2 TRINITY_DN2630_c0_g1~~TRINITY_DN2630_c0_g1_i2.p2  ORF type:complete len:106 (-),score=3.87 TRINITY_DN2630_c0_g1_i2:10-327(-)